MSSSFSDRLNAVIPGGAHTYSRGDDQFPANAPQILKKGKGAYVWSPEGEKYLDYGMALRAVTLGYAHDEVNAAAIEQIQFGNNLTRASVVELEAAETLVKMIPCADMVKFGKNGSSVTSAAVKLARAYTGRKMVARCLQHPFFSYDDWFIGDTVVKRGVPEEIMRLTANFNYNDISSLEDLFAKYPGQLACVIMEPATTEDPKDQFLQKVRDLCVKNGSVFILDEMITGFRWHMQGAHTLYGVKPDLVTFGKAMANGFSVAAVAGKKEIMNLGSIKTEGQERVFLMSSTHGAEMCGMAAFMKTMEISQRENVVEHMWKYGQRLKDEGNRVSQKLGLLEYFKFDGIACSPYYLTKDKQGQVSMEMRTLFAQEMVKNKILMPWISISLAHGEAEMKMTLDALEKSLAVYAQALEKGVDKFLQGKAIKPVFRSKN
jgi:glutamate-1-semialdehyde 2,1-aminomutase